MVASRDRGRTRDTEGKTSKHQQCDDDARRRGRRHNGDWLLVGGLVCLLQVAANGNGKRILHLDPSPTPSCCHHTKIELVDTTYVAASLRSIADTARCRILLAASFALHRAHHELGQWHSPHLHDLQLVYGHLLNATGGYLGRFPYTLSKSPVMYFLSLVALVKKRRVLYRAFETAPVGSAYSSRGQPGALNRRAMD